MRGAVLLVLLSWTVSPAMAAPARSLLQAHREADHRNPTHHLDEARRVLDRAWSHATADERGQLDRLRTDFAALALVFARVPSGPATGAWPPAVATTGSDPVAPKSSAGAEPTESGATVPPKTSRSTPQPATSDRRPAEWQMKYAEVDRDLKGIAPSGNRALARRLDHFRLHLQMFYSAALGREP